MTSESIILKILHSFKDAVDYEMVDFLPQLGIEPVTASAFSIARYKIKPAFFKDFAKYSGDEALKIVPPKLWKTYRLLAGDGTTFSLPVSKDTIDHFGIYAQTESGTKTVMASSCMIYDVLNNIVWDANLSTMKSSEFSLIQEMLDTRDLDKSILILDRGFSKFYFYKILQQKKVKFCIRQKTTGHNFSQAMLNRTETDFIAEWHPSPAEMTTCKSKGLDIKPLKVRVTKMFLPSGEVELLITNLYDIDFVSTEDIKELYHFRWGVEEAFKLLKPQMKVEQFGCKKTQGVLQEFYAHIVMLNIIAVIGCIARELVTKRTEKRKHKYKYNRVNAWKFIRSKLVGLYLQSKPVNLIRQLVDGIVRCIVAVRPGRSFPRDHRFKRKNRPSPTYK